MQDLGTIIFFGDSITKGYVPFLEKKLKTKFSKVNMVLIDEGVSGETSGDGLKRIDRVIEAKPDLVVIGFGMNDLNKDVPVDNFKENLIKIVENLETHHIRCILATFNPSYGDKLFRAKKRSTTYNNVIRKISKEKGTKLADINNLWLRKFKIPWIGLRDKMHPNRIGYKVYCDALMNVVVPKHTVVLWQYNGRECLCNYKCPYCYYSYSPKAENYYWGAIDTWRKSFKDTFGNQNLVFYLAFGEPTLGEAFYDVVKMIEDEPNWKLRITSNISQDLERLVATRLAREGRLFINASFHPTEIGLDVFVEKLLFLRKHGIESPVIYVMWPPFLDRFEKDFEVFDRNNFLVHVRRFKGKYKGKYYPYAYTALERQFIAKYCDDATIKYMLNEKPVFHRRTYSGFNFFIVDCTGNVGIDSDCFNIYSKYRTFFGNIIQSNTLKFLSEPMRYPIFSSQGTVDGVSNYIETDYSQLTDNNIISFAQQGGVCRTENEVVYGNKDKDFSDSRIRAEYYFPSRGVGDEWSLLLSQRPFFYLMYSFGRVGKWIWMRIKKHFFK